jgi:hypothetical protein
MTAQDLTSLVTALFILGMIWLRTRMQYAQRGRRLQLQRAGRIYFGCAIGLLAAGWWIAPAAGAGLWPAGAANPTLMRVIWFLVTYYVFIVVHRALKARGTEVFRIRQAPDILPPSGAE